MDYITKYDKLTKQTSYNNVTKHINNHGKEPPKSGQIKLLLSEILFLTKCANDGDTVLYVGAGSQDQSGGTKVMGGNHIRILLKLFPNLNWELFDKGFIDVTNNPNVRKYQRYFEDDDCQNYQKQNVLFICDIRNIDIGKSKSIGKQIKDRLIKKEIEQDLSNIMSDDMQKQFKWCQLMNPKYAYLKFVLPYQSGKTTYFNGTLYLQQYIKFSTETRLLTNNYLDLIEYDNTIYEQKLAAFNLGPHLYYKSQRWQAIMNQYNLRNNYDNAGALYIIEYYLRNKYKNINISDEMTVDLFLAMIKYLQK